MTSVFQLQDYSLIGKTADEAIKKGLAEAVWYQSPVPREQMRELLKRRDWPAARDTMIWFSLLISSGLAAYYLWGSWWSIIPFTIYGIIYGSSSDSRWHECGHGTAFKTDWMNNTLYEIASFMLMRESAVWRWSHVRHHSDTVIVGRDPEIAVPRPPSFLNILLELFSLKTILGYFQHLFLHAQGQLTQEEKTFVPKTEEGKVFFIARVHLIIYCFVIGLCFYYGSLLPLMFVGLPSLYGAWLKSVWGLTQHAGLAENVLDHRLNSRTVYMNFINRFLYWNMNYHIEHHMFPLVPYHALPKLHALIKEDLPPSYNSIWDAYKEIFSALWRQKKDPNYFVKRELPVSKIKRSETRIIATSSDTTEDKDGWIKVCHKEDINTDDIIRFDYGDKTFAIYRTLDNEYYATEGMCTHGKKHLSEGLIVGKQIECPKHNGRFDLRDGSPKRAPVCISLKTYAVKITNNELWLNPIDIKEENPNELAENEYLFKVVSNHNVATFIKELVLEPIVTEKALNYQPGEYTHIKIPAYKLINFSDFIIEEPYRKIWKAQAMFNHSASNSTTASRSYSMASTYETDHTLKFNVRIAIPPENSNYEAGTGSSYIFNLQPGDKVIAIGPAGDFHIKNTGNEMIYLGGGAGMAPLKSHITHLFETLKTDRKVSFWYGARSLQEVFYADYFKELEEKFDNFSFHLALSEAQTGDNWVGSNGFIHEVLRGSYLKNHNNPRAIEYYLCGPPMMIQASKKMLLEEFSIDSEKILYDEF